MFALTSLGPVTGTRLSLQEGEMNSAAKICTIKAEQLLGKTLVSPGHLYLCSNRTCHSDLLDPYFGMHLSGCMTAEHHRQFGHGSTAEKGLRFL